MQDKCPKFGPKPRTPSFMQCFYFLSFDLKLFFDRLNISTINQLKYAILSEFEFGGSPIDGTDYNLLNIL